MKEGLYTALVSAFLSSCAPPYTPPPNLPSSIAKIDTPHEARRWLDTVLKYKYDKDLYKTSDFWAPCGLTYKNRAGDCEDHAICAAALLQGDVEQGYIIVLYDPSNEKRAAHAVFAYRLDNKWGVLSNDSWEFRLPRFVTLDEVLSDINNARGSRDRFLRYNVRDYSGVDLVNGSENLVSKIKEIEDHPLLP